MYLTKNKYKTIFLPEWYFLQNSTSISLDKTIALTFDDGYLDNWVYVYPILRKYNLNATIFINPEFVDPSGALRPTIEEVWNGKLKADSLESLGFLNWPEIQALDATVHIDIQSHSMSHNFYFLSNNIIDIYTGQKNYDWIAWFLRPQSKPYYIHDNHLDTIPIGYPIFEFGRALGLRRYFPDQRVVDFSVANRSNLSSINRILKEKISTYPGRFETDEEMKVRYWYELSESKRILEEKLNKNIGFLCWPGGGYNELSIELSQEAGYIASTIASRERNIQINNNGPYKRIKRFGMGSYISTVKHKHLVKTPNHLIHNYKGRTGNMYYRNLIRTKKIMWHILDVFK